MENYLTTKTIKTSVRQPTKALKPIAEVRVVLISLQEPVQPVGEQKVQAFLGHQGVEALQHRQQVAHHVPLLVQGDEHGTCRKN